MLVTLEKAGEILAKGSHTAITTTDGKIALVPKGKETLKVNYPAPTAKRYGAGFQ
ncbi:putative RNA binding protein YcfA (HicA-like mRNA interferase family) [Thermostichus sp. MS-CIW-32]